MSGSSHGNPSVLFNLVEDLGERCVTRRFTCELRQGAETLIFVYEVTSLETTPYSLIMAPASPLDSLTVLCDVIRGEDILGIRRASITWRKATPQTSPRKPRSPLTAEICSAPVKTPLVLQIAISGTQRLHVSRRGSYPFEISPRFMLRLPPSSGGTPPPV